ncbi:DUF1998 domain-containing protein [Paraclostridium sordellii]|uniref:DUF1998 domain-containing protein n=1 Tax=Paraclostridium sordellii TaxID=1505 RepID=UPI001C6164BB|nr:DUF1998 domain-containing protein [Paeniclostridium sordellii]QYE99106.1 DUF1998 domain-containing protein [Paeniclostridium sordellii]
MSLRDNEMNRSITQSLYKYLPEAWVDFYVKKTRTMYTARVRNWNSELLTDINSSRLIEKVKSNIVAFEGNGGKLDGFGDLENIGADTYEVRTPKTGINPDIFAEVNPLIFYCSGCNKIETLRESSDVKKYTIPKSRCCDKPLKQISLIYSCYCGWAGPVVALPCDRHGFENLKYNGSFAFKCGICNTTKQMIKYCPTCKTQLYPKPALDGSHFIPFSLSTIDLINMKEEEFLSKEGIDGAKVIVGNWVGNISDEKYKSFVNRGIPKDGDESKKEEYENMVNVFMKYMNQPEEMARINARREVYKDTEDLLNEIENYFETKIRVNDISRCASSILEYYRILNGENNKSYKSTLEDAKKISKDLNTSTDYDRYEEIASAFGIKNIQACGNVPFLFCSYGYTRKSNDPGTNIGKLTLKAFPSEGKVKKNIYSVKLNTEGILIEFDKKKILEWLVKNEFMNKDDLPVDMDNETELKEWFINNIEVDKIPTFNEIDKNNHEKTSYVYNLLHSMSHALIKQAGDLCGLDKNSLSEYIFPQVPAIFIYCQNSQGLSLGALFNLFEAYFDKWLRYTLNSIDKCIFDPICLDRDKACTGCLYINEVSCVHFNKDLDRRYLVGHFDKSTKEKIYGFWEGVLNGYNVSQ